MFMNLSSNKKGFTLIELLVVVAIIGVLASIVLSSLSQSRLAARDAKRISLLRNIETALELYYLDHQGYPQCLTATFRSDIAPGVECFQDAMAPYITLDLLDPLTSYLSEDGTGSGPTFYYASKPVNNFQTYGMFTHLLTDRYLNVSADDGGNWNAFYEVGEDPRYCASIYETGNSYSDADWYHVPNLSTRCIGGN